jgi:hypothetical protein
LRLVKHEFQKRGHDTHFLMWVSFLVAFASSRIWAVTIGHSVPDLTATYSVGRRVIVAGYHIHHIGFGILLIVIAGFLTLHYAGRRLNRLSAVFYGVGLGFIVDEIGFVVGGIEPYSGDYEVFFLVVVISSLFMVGIYWPKFYRGLQWPVRMAYVMAMRRRERSARAQRPAQQEGQAVVPVAEDEPERPR